MAQSNSEYKYTTITPDINVYLKLLLYDKIQPFKIFYPHCLAIDSVICYAKHNEEGVVMSRKEYNFECTLIDSVPYNFLVNKPIYSQIGQVAYLFAAVENEKKELDELDNKFLKTNVDAEGWIKEEYYGLHPYEGYYGIFRPKLLEIMTLISSKWSKEQIEKEVERIYVTTEPHPSGRECYDVKADRHRAKTTIYIVKK